MLEQIQPNHADHISGYKTAYIEDMLKKEVCIAQPKYDGERMLIHIDHSTIYCTSRRFSKKTGQYVENQDKLPILKQIFSKFLDVGYTVIDCECYSKDWSTIAGILHSLPERAIELQKENPAKFACFDCLFYNGVDLREFEYCYRLQFLKRIFKHFVSDPNCHIVKFMNKEVVDIDNMKAVSSLEDAQERMDRAISAGFEGIVIKSLERKYYDKAAVLKCKKFETVDVVVIGYQEGNGKYSGQVGALRVGYYRPETDEFVYMSKVNCGTDEDRMNWTQHKDELLHSVIEVKCQEITKTSLRHPVLIRRREDKSYEMCTKEIIFKE